MPRADQPAQQDLVLAGVQTGGAPAACPAPLIGGPRRAQPDNGPSHSGAGRRAARRDPNGRGVDIMWSETATADSFARNTTVCRCEMRANSSQLSPLGIVLADLTP
jgi:hypothetical protein